MSISSDAALHVLHVDDEPSVAETASTFLERESDRLHVETETDPEGVLEILEEERVDCIVSDYDMPEMDGVDLLESVREKYPDLPFILFTGMGSEEVASEAISAGVTDYMQKETGTDQYAVLANRIENAVHQARTERQLEETRHRLTELAESSTDCLWMFDSDWEELLFISGYEDIWERPEAKIRENPRDFLEGVYADDRSFVRDAMETVSAGQSVDIEFRIQKGTDETGWVWTKANPVRDERGEVVRVVGFTRDVTERKRVERDREQQNVVLETVLENLPEGILVEDEDRQIFLANDALVEMLDAPMEANDLIGRDFAAAADELNDVFARPDEFVDGIESILADRSPVRNEEFELTDGRALTRDFVPYTLPDGQANLWIYRDVTPFKERQRELERHESILETFPEGVFILDTDGVILDMFGSPEKMTGYPRHELQGESFEMLVEAGVFRQQAIDTYLDAVKHLLDEDTDEEHVTYEVTAMPDEDSTRTYQVRLTLFDDAREKGSVGVVRDVTERKQREWEIARLQEETEFALNATDSIIWTLDLEADEFLTLRGPAENVFGADASVGQSIENLFDFSVHPEDRDELEDLYQSMTQGERKSVQLSFRTHPDVTEVRWIEASGYVREREGSRQLVGLASDVTDQKRRAEELERQNERLEDFAGVVSHDLRNPLNVAGGRLELATEDCDSEHILEALSALDRMESLIDDMLVLAQNGERVQGTQPIELARVAEECWGNVSTGAATLSTDVDLSIEADSGRVKQLLENLFRNAVEHGPDDVSVTVGECEDGFFVADNGPGIPGDSHEAIFEMGYTTSEKGTGFGLAIVEEIATAHGWEIEVTDSDFGGTRFEVRGVEYAT